MSPSSALAREALPAVAVIGFLTVLVFPAELPRLFGPDGFGWASWCLALAGPVLAVALATGAAPRSRLLWPTAAYLGCVVATGVFSVDTSNTALEGAKLFGIVGAAFAVAWLVRRGGRLEGIAVVWLMSLISVVQLLAFMNHVEYGLAERITGYVLPAGWGGYPELGPLVCVQFAVCLAVLVTARTWPARAAAVGLVAMTVLMAAFLYSRLAWVSMAAVFVALPLVALRRRTLVPLALGTFALVVVLLGVMSASPTFRQLAQGAATGEFGGAGVVEGVTLHVANLDTRTALWERTARMIKDHWAAGVGFGNFRAVYEPNYNPNPNDDGRRGVHAHNAFLQQAAELGIAGGTAFLGLWAVTLVWALMRARSSHGVVDLAIVACLVALLVQNVGENLHSSLDGPRGRLTALVWVVLVLSSMRRSAHGAPSHKVRPVG